MAKALLDGPYRKDAIVPASPWLDNIPPLAPQADFNKSDTGTVMVTWTHPDVKDVFRWIVYFKRANEPWNYTIRDREENKVYIALNGQPVRIGVTAVDRTGNESKFIELKK
jgi:hypothetical protein